MSDTIMSKPAPRTDAEYAAAIEECVAEMARIHEQIEEEQRRIDRLKAETRAILKTFTRK